MFTGLTGAEIDFRGDFFSSDPVFPFYYGNRGNKLRRRFKATGDAEDYDFDLNHAFATVDGRVFAIDNNKQLRVILPSLNSFFIDPIQKDFEICDGFKGHVVCLHSDFILRKHYFKGNFTSYQQTHNVFKTSFQRCFNADTTF